MKNRNLVIVILAVICAGLLAGVVYTVTKGKSGTQKKQEASAEAGADETESQSGIIEEDGKKYKINPDIKDIFSFKYEDFELVNYDPWPHIAGKVSV